MSKMRTALVGLGLVVEQIHLPACAAIPELELVAGCDPSPVRRSWAEKRGVPTTYPDAVMLLEREKPELVLIATPPDTHRDMCLLALKYGAHVLCEKPFVAQLQEADEVVAAARATLGWTAPAFEIPQDIADGWAEIGKGGRAVRAAWGDRLATNGQAAEFTRRMKGELPPGNEAMKAYLDGLTSNPPKVATRKASEMALEAMTAVLPEMVGGSADLTGSNFTKTTSTNVLSKNDYSGRYINYGIREFGMAAAMNGMALHGGIIP